MSLSMKLGLSRLGIVSSVSALMFAAMSGAAFAQSLPDMKSTAEVVATMNIIQLFAYIALTSTGLTVLMVGVYVRTVSKAQTGLAAWMATISAGQASMAASLHDVAQNCNNKKCPL